MLPKDKGRRIRLSANRSLVIDGCHYALSIPFFPVERLCDLSEVARQRKLAATRISWSAVFIKAFAIVARDCPTLRRSYVRWPWPHLYEAPHSVAMLAMNRQFAGEDRLCWGRFLAPDITTLVEIQQALESYQNDPVEQIFKRQVFLSRLPRPLRRIVWWLNFNASGHKRPKRLGTFSMSSLAGQGAVNRLHFTVLTTSLSYGPLDDAGGSLVTLICDHRVVDGALAAQALIDLERTLNGAIAEELSKLTGPSLAA